MFADLSEGEWVVGTDWVVGTELRDVDGREARAFPGVGAMRIVLCRE